MPELLSVSESDVETVILAGQEVEEVKTLIQGLLQLKQERLEQANILCPPCDGFC